MDTSAQDTPDINTDVVPAPPVDIPGVSSIPQPPASPQESSTELSASSLTDNTKGSISPSSSPEVPEAFASLTKTADASPAPEEAVPVPEAIVTSSSPSDSVSVPTPPPAVNNQPESTNAQFPPMSEAPKPSTPLKGPLLLILVLVLVFAASTAGGYYVGANKNNDDTSGATTPSPTETLPTPEPESTLPQMFKDGNYSYTLPVGWKVLSDIEGEYATDTENMLILRSEKIEKASKTLAKDELHAFVTEKELTLPAGSSYTFVSEKAVTVGDLKGWFAHLSVKDAEDEEAIVIVEDTVTKGYAVLVLKPFTLDSSEVFESIYLSFKNSSVQGLSTSVSPSASPSGNLSPVPTKKVSPTPTKKVSVSPTGSVKTSVTVTPAN